MVGVSFVWCRCVGARLGERRLGQCLWRETCHCERISCEYGLGSAGAIFDGIRFERDSKYGLDCGVSKVLDIYSGNFGIGSFIIFEVLQGSE